MRRSLRPTGVAAALAVFLVVGLLAGAAVASNGDHTFYGCEGKGKLISWKITVDRPANCTHKQNPVSWTSGGNGGGAAPEFYSNSTSGGSGSGDIAVSCDAGDAVTGGGYVASVDVDVYSSGETAPGTWTVSWIAPPDEGSITVTVYCVSTG